MHDILGFIEKIDKEGIEKCLSNPSIWPNIEKTRIYFETLDESEKNKISAALAHVLSLVEKEIVTIQAEKEDLQADMNKSKERLDACVAYLKSAKANEIPR